ncbi:primase-like DNA-binding domain-containing protein, partial [Tritonibacter multivorans]
RKLMAELPGILNWAVKGCMEWQKQGLNPPKIVLDQVAAYKTSMDSVSQFVDQECEIDTDAKFGASKLYEEYRGWCQAMGNKPQSTTSFKRSLEKLPGVYQNRASSGMQWHGIRPALG